MPLKTKKAVPVALKDLFSKFLLANTITSFVEKKELSQANFSFLFC